MFCKYCGNEIKGDGCFCSNCGNKIKENNINDSYVELKEENSAKDLGMILCPSCGQGISNQAEMCPHCGYKTDIGKMSEKKLMKLKWEGEARIILIMGVILWGIGMVLFFVSFPTILDDINRHRYTYGPPLTNHETENLTKLFIGVIMVSVGIGMDIVVAIRTKKLQKEM